MIPDKKAIREALAKATPGKWEVLAVGGDVISDKVVVYRAGISIAKGISSQNDSFLIDNAPTWLLQLLNDHDRLVKLLQDVSELISWRDRGNGPEQALKLIYGWALERHPEK